MEGPPNTTAREERTHHRYVTNRIPWYVHLLWFCFWALAIGYIVSYLIPALRNEQFDRSKTAPPAKAAKD
jgi:hypothetical protein